MRYFKIIFSIVCIILISFFVAKSCVRKISHPRPAIHQKVFFKRPLAAIPQKGAQAIPPFFSHPKMAIILDDWGMSYAPTALAINIKEPITLSVLPNLKNSEKIAETAYENHLGVMLHMPMQPKNPKEKLEPRTILTTTPDTDIVAYLDTALLTVPHAEGVNNHMGSAATSDLRVMRAVLSHLKRKELFFVDSFTIKESKGPQIAKETGVRFTKRDIFIDNKIEAASIKEALRQAKDIALKKGSVVVIGHDHNITLLAIKEMVPELKKAGIEFVLVKDLAE